MRQDTDDAIQHIYVRQKGPSTVYVHSVEVQSHWKAFEREQYQIIERRRAKLSDLPCMQFIG